MQPSRARQTTVQSRIKDRLALPETFHGLVLCQVFQELLWGDPHPLLEKPLQVVWAKADMGRKFFKARLFLLVTAKPVQSVANYLIMMLRFHTLIVRVLGPPATRFLRFVPVIRWFYFAKYRKIHYVR